MAKIPAIWTSKVKPLAPLQPPVACPAIVLLFQYQILYQWIVVVWSHLESASALHWEIILSPGDVGLGQTRRSTLQSHRVSHVRTEVLRGPQKVRLGCNTKVAFRQRYKQQLDTDENILFFTLNGIIERVNVNVSQCGSLIYIETAYYPRSWQMS